MVYVRLLDFFNRKRTLYTLQCEGRAKRTNIDHLLSLEATVRKAQANGEQVVFILFDMKKKTCGILVDLDTSYNRKKCIQFHTKLSQTKSFKVKFNEFSSGRHIQTQSIPTGSVVIPTFFKLKINKIVAHLPNDNRFQISLHTNGVQISYRHADWRIVDKRLQDSKDIVEDSPKRTASSSPQAKLLCYTLPKSRALLQNKFETLEIKCLKEFKTLA